MATTAEWTDYWRRYAEAEESGEPLPEAPEGEPEFIKGVTPGLGPTFEDWLAEQNVPQIISAAPRSRDLTEFISALTNPNERNWQRFVYPMVLSDVEAKRLNVNLQPQWKIRFIGVGALGEPEWVVVDPQGRELKSWEARREPFQPAAPEGLVPRPAQPFPVVPSPVVPLPPVPPPLRSPPIPLPRAEDDPRNFAVLGGARWRAIYPDGSEESGEFLSREDTRRIQERGGVIYDVTKETEAKAENRRIQDVRDVIKKLIPGRSVDDSLAELENNQPAFLDRIIAHGITQDTMFLLRGLGATDDEIRQMFAPPIEPPIEPTGVSPARLALIAAGQRQRAEKAKWDLLRQGGVRPEEVDKIQALSQLELDSEGWMTKWKSIEPSAKKTLTYSLFGRSFASGLGGIVKGAAGVAGWRRQENWAKNLNEIGDVLQSNRPILEPWKPSLATLTDPRFYQTTIAEALPFTLSIIPAAIIGYQAVAAGLGLTGLGALWVHVLASIGVGTGGAIVESAVEAGGGYNEAKRRGWSDEEATKVADEVFAKDFALLSGGNAAEVFVAFMPTPGGVLGNLIKRGLVRVIRVGGKVTGVALTEGGTETLQDVFNRQALGEKVAWDDDMKMTAMVGGIMGGLFGASGEVFTTIQQRLVARLPAEIKTQFEGDKADLIAKGASEEVATFKALDNLGENKEVQRIADDIVKEVKQEEAIKQVTPTDKIEALAWERVAKIDEAMAEVKVEAAKLVVPEAEAIPKPEAPAGVKEGIAPVTPEGAKPPVTKATQYSIDKVENALKTIEELAPKETVRESAIRRRQLVSAYDSLELHARKLGVIIPKLGTYYNPEEYLSKARQMSKDIQQRYLSKVTIPEAEPKPVEGMPEAGVQPSMIEEAELPSPPTEITQAPLPAMAELTEAEVTEQKDLPAMPRYNLEQIDALIAPFAEYVMNPTTVTAYEFARKSLALQRSQRFNNLSDKLAEIQVQTGEVTEEKARQIISDTLSGKYWVEMSDYLQFITDEMRDAHFAKVAYALKDYPAEYAGTITALVNALSGRPIPNVRPTPPPGGFKSKLWPQGASALDKLQFVFGKSTEPMKALGKMATEKKSLVDIVEGVFREAGQTPIPIDQATAEYLRNLPTEPREMIRLGEQEGILTFREAEDLRNKITDLKVNDQRTAVEKIIEMRRKGLLPPPPVAKFDAPIEKVFEQPVLKDWPIRERIAIVRVLKGVGWGAVDIFNALRALKTTLDNSFLRQGKVLAAGHPLVAFKAHNNSWRMMFNQSVAEERWELITRKPWFPGYEEIRIKTGHDPLRVPAFAARKGTAQYRTAEEFGFPTVERWIPRMTAKLPIIKPFERAFSGGTNEIVAGIMDIKWKQTLRQAERIASGEITLKVGESFDIEQEMTAHQGFLADLIQRATLPERARGLAPVFNAFFFALRSKLGRFLAPTHLLGMTRTGKKIGFNARTMREAWKDFVLFNAEIGGIMFLGSWLGLWDLEDDPRNAEFMSARIGNTRLDPWAGYRQFVVLYARLVTKTGISSVTGAEYEANPKGAVQSFIENSFSPGASILLEFWTGRNFLGQVIDFADKRYWIEKITAMSLWDLWEAFEDAGWGRAAQMLIPAVYGEGVQTYTGDWRENFTKLGLPKYLENTAYGITDPKYDAGDLWADTAHQFKGVDPATLTTAKGFPPYIKAMAEALQTLELTDLMPNVKLISINADPMKDGVKTATFADYYKLWKDRQKLVEAGDKAVWTDSELQPDGTYKTITYKGKDALIAFDKKEGQKPAQSRLGNISQTQFALLNEYWAITDKKKQADFLAGLSEEQRLLITTNLVDEWYKSHPKENAILAVHGKMDALTQKAYDLAIQMARDWDYPDSAIAPYLPPKDLAKTHFERIDTVNKWGANSWEDKLLRATEEGKKWVEWFNKNNPDKALVPIDTPIEALKLQTILQYHETWDKLNKEGTPGYVGDLDDKLKDKDGLTARDRAIRDLKETMIGKERYIDLDRRIEAIKKGTDEKPVDTKLVESHVKYGKLLETEGIGSGSAEAMLYRVDDPDYDKWRQDKDVWGNQALQPVDQGQIPIWRIDVKYRQEDKAYDALPETGPARADYLANHEAYRIARRQREFYKFHVPIPPGKSADAMRDKYVNYSILPEKGKYRDRFLMNNRDLEAILIKYAGRTTIVDASTVPDERWDAINEQFKRQFALLDSFKDPTSPNYEPNEARRAQKGELYKKANPDFQKAIWEQDALEKFIGQEEFVPLYVEYFDLVSKGKPGYEDDWYLMAHPEFYKAMVDKKYWQPRDFGKVPTRHVWELFQIYNNIAGDETMSRSQARIQMRRTYPELDSWLFITGIVKETLEEHDLNARMTAAERRARDIVALEAANEARKKAMGLKK